MVIYPAELPLLPTVAGRKKSSQVKANGRGRLCPAWLLGLDGDSISGLYPLSRGPTAHAWMAPSDSYPSQRGQMAPHVRYYPPSQASPVPLGRSHGAHTQQNMLRKSQDSADTRTPQGPRPRYGDPALETGRAGGAAQAATRRCASRPASPAPRTSAAINPAATALHAPLALTGGGPHVT